MTSRSNFIVETEYEFFEYYALLLFFFRIGLEVPKNNPTKKQIDAEIQATLKHAPAWKLTEGKMQSLSLQIAKIDLNCKLQLLALDYQKYSPRGDLWKRRSWKFCKTHRKTLAPEPLF